MLITGKNVNRLSVGRHSFCNSRMSRIFYHARREAESSWAYGDNAQRCRVENAAIIRYEMSDDLH